MNKRNTVQRTLVLEAVKELQCHATADEIYTVIAKKHPDISKATVYRNLNLLSEMGEIRKREVPGGADRYDHQCDEHYHIRCLECGRIFDVDMAFMADLEKNIRNAHGFAFMGHDVMFKGICPDCNAERTGGGSPTPSKAAKQSD